VREQVTVKSATTPIPPSFVPSGEAASPQLINCKLRPPLPAATCVVREHLLDRIALASRRKVLLLIAPTGSGKSTLLTHWHARDRHGRTIAWLSLDEHDDAPARFFAYLLGAVRSVVPDIDARVASRLDHEAAVTEQFDRVTADLTIVIDDCQCLTSPAVCRALDYVIRRSPHNVHWVLSGRCAPDVNIGALRLNDELATMGGADLSFDSALIMELSRKLSRRALSAKEADCIRERTEGWIAGVKLALLAREEARHAGETLQTFAGSRADVALYFGESVLQDQPADIREFLLWSSIVDRMTGELCDALLGSYRSQALLERLERAQLFIQPLDGHRHWFRYHTLFLDFLRGRLRRDHAAALPSLHERASRWYAEHQFFEDALRHAFESRNLAWRNELLGRCLAIWLQNGEIAAVLDWVGRVTTDVIANDASIGRSYVSALILSRRFDEASLALRDLRRTTGAEGTASLEVLETMFAILADSDDQRDVDARALQSPGVDPFLDGTLLTLKAYALLRRNQFDASRRIALRARDVLQHVSHYSRGYAEVVAALADRAQGDMKCASDRCEATFANVRNGRRSPAWVNAATPVAYVRYEENRLADAEALCMEILPLLSGASTIESLATAYVTLARIRAASGSMSEANQLLDYLHSVLEGGAHRRFLAQVWSEKILVCLRERDVTRATQLAREWGLESRAHAGEFVRPRSYDEAWERAGSAYAQLLLASGLYAEATVILVTLRDSAREAGYIYRQVRLEAALACALAQAGQDADSFAALNGALALTRGYGFTRGVFDESPSLTPLIRRALQHDMLRHTLPFHYLRKFDNLFVERPAERANGSVKVAAMLPLEPLTDREIDILKLLARGLSNSQISRQSQIALSTAKWHLKNVFAKLDVSTRTGALARARELRLVD
jgi:LuxR family transcriptional regulator, maltose regulon positive regulatory protein